MKKSANRSNLKTDQNGMASFVITMVMTIIISLLVFGFSQTARDETASSTNRQLSTQAFYAAESGINDAVQDIQNYVTANPGLSPPAKNNCSNTGDPAYTALNGTVNSATSLTYPCILINPSPKSLIYVGTSAVFAVDALSNINTITVNWVDDPDTTPGYGGCLTAQNHFPNTTWPATCTADVLQFDLVPLSALTNNMTANLEHNTFTTFLYPTPNAGADTVTDPTSGTGYVQAGDCNNAGGCTAQINVSAVGQPEFYIRFSAMYGIPQTVTITANTSVNGPPVPLYNSQAIIDSTGKDFNELKRIEVRVPILAINNNIFPNVAIESNQTICKQFEITPPGGSGVAGIDPTPGAIFPGALCTTT